MRGSMRPMNMARKPDAGADTARRSDFADQRIGKAGMLLQWGQQGHRCEGQHAMDADQQQAQRIVAVEQETQIEEGLGRAEAVRQEAGPIEGNPLGRSWGRNSLSPMEDRNPTGTIRRTRSSGSATAPRRT